MVISNYLLRKVLDIFKFWHFSRPENILKLKLIVFTAIEIDDCRQKKS